MTINRQLYTQHIDLSKFTAVLRVSYVAVRSPVAILHHPARLQTKLSTAGAQLAQNPTILCGSSISRGYPHHPATLQTKLSPAGSKSNDTSKALRHALFVECCAAAEVRKGHPSPRYWCWLGPPSHRLKNEQAEGKKRGLGRLSRLEV